MKGALKAMKKYRLFFVIINLIAKRLVAQDVFQ